ncbi:MAG: cation transporter [Ignavibacteria bacterium]
MSTSENLPENITDQNLKTQIGVNEELFEFDIIGMDCTSCAKNIKLYLERLDGINSVEINYATESGDVIYDPGKIDRKKIKEEVKNTGYDLISEDDEYEAEQVKKQSIKKQKDKIFTAIALSLIIMTLSMKDHIPVINMIDIPYKVILVVLFILTSVMFSVRRQIHQRSLLLQ